MEGTQLSERGGTDELKDMEKKLFNMLALEGGVVEVQPSKERTEQDEGFVFQYFESSNDLHHLALMNSVFLFLIQDI